MNEKVNENAKVKQLTNILGTGVRLIVILPMSSRVSQWYSCEQYFKNWVLNSSINEIVFV